MLGELGVCSSSKLYERERVLEEEHEGVLAAVVDVEEKEGEADVDVVVADLELIEVEDDQTSEFDGGNEAWDKRF